MAIMIPDLPPSKRGSVHSENELWKELKHQLSDDFYIYHSLPYLTTDSKQGEVDFLLVHPEYGLLVLECKGGGVGRDAHGKWFRQYHGKRERMEPPMEQASRQARAVVAGLREPLARALGWSGNGFPVVYGWALAFPLSQRDDLNLPLDLQPEIVIDSRDIGRDLEAKVIEAFKFQARRLANPPRITRDEFGILRSIICPAVDFAETIAGEIDLGKQAIKRLSKNQANLINSMISMRRFQVAGGAGTGKTVMALQGARLLAEDGHHVLITCFNSKLAEYMRRTVDGWSRLSGRVDVLHFHGLCAKANEDLGGVLEFPGAGAARDEQRHFWKVTAAEVITRAVEAGQFSLGPWDAIFVDEAQDFARHWFEILETQCLRDEKSKLALFYDEGQSIFKHSAEIPEWPAVFQLTENFRNTKSIVESIRPLSSRPMESHDEAVAGVQPKIFRQGDDLTTQTILGNLLTKLIVQENVKPAQITILSPHSPRNSSLAQASELNGHAIVFDLKDWPRGVLHSTISGFKGLEADIIIMIDIDPNDPRCTPQDRYAGASRAKHRLYIFEKEDWLRDIRN